MSGGKTARVKGWTGMGGEVEKGEGTGKVENSGGK
jgi:hypothetical protein